MTKAKASHEVTQALDALYASVVHLTEKNRARLSFLGRCSSELNAITQARRTRVHLSTGIVPELLWMVLYIGAILTVGFTFFFGTKNLPAQVMMTGILSVLVFVSLLLIVSFNHPFTGLVHVGNEPLQHAIEPWLR